MSTHPVANHDVSSTAEKPDSRPSVKPQQQGALAAAESETSTLNSSQPSPKPPMTTQSSSTPESEEEEKSQDVAKDAKDQLVQYYNNDTQLQQQVQGTEDQAKAYAQGLWSKYCGCFA
ncbi:hypothetical protein D9757_000809 [Collybiopsis confluens]|uniref:Uncharacterized protein n=1 Tax=Collybiopsis confluens TaxID=2823264 RepID=A0A8H5I0R1_9AGAR|nr:hypothetical protein D9757_000809 [Collybiopsis confluens]